MAEKCVGMGSWVSTSQFKYLLRMNELYKRERERAHFQKFTLQPETFNAFHCAFLLFSVSGQSVFECVV